MIIVVLVLVNAQNFKRDTTLLRGVCDVVEVGRREVNWESKEAGGISMIHYKRGMN